MWRWFDVRKSGGKVEKRAGGVFSVLSWWRS